MQKNLVHLKPAEYLRNVFMTTPPAGTTLEDIQEGRFWEHVAKKLRPGDRIEVSPEDCLYLAELIVVSVAQHRVVVALRNHTLLQPTEASEKEFEAPSEFEYKYRGATKKHCIMRVKDNSPLKEGCNSKDEAVLWLANYQKGLAN